MPSFSFSYNTYENLRELASTKQELVNKAIKATQHAYAPYSKFSVGCAILLENKQIITGTNVENASYPVGICAERTALSHVVSNHPNERIRSMAISYLSEKVSDEVIFPCGMCRQFILECQQRNQAPIEVILHAPNGKIILVPNAADLLPFGFTGKML